MPGIPYCRFWGILVVWGLALGGLSGCSAGIGRDCEVDSDCSAAQMCARGECTRTCTTDEDCTRSSYACRPLEDSQRDERVNVCVAVDAGSGDAGDGECRSDEECIDELGPHARCGLDGRCIVEERRAGLLVDDLTDPEDESTPEQRRGAEIGAIYLAGDSGEPTAFARTIAYEPGGGLEGASHLEGDPPRLSDDRQCVEPPLEEATSPLGGGQLLVEFVDADGQAVEIEPDQEVVVIEWAHDNCGQSLDDADTYNVSYCVSSSATLETEDCDDRLASEASGRTVVVPRPADSGGDTGVGDAGTAADAH